MDRDEKYLVRIMFQNKIYSSDAQKFEDLFTQIMGYRYHDFRSVKPQGPLGDMKNDGYLIGEGKFYQVYGPEDISKSIDTAISKLKEDLNGLLEKWSADTEIKEFNYVVNDKYKGANVTVHKKLIELDNVLKDLAKEKKITTNLVAAKDLENMLFELNDDDIISVVGLIPRTTALYDVDYASLNEVIDHILNLPAKNYSDELYIPDFDEKIQFNGLNKIISRRLEAASINTGDIEIYFDSQSDFLREEIKNRFKDLYSESKNKINDDEENFADIRYIYILEKSRPNECTNLIQQAVECLMAFYFESCDIFEAPED